MSIKREIFEELNRLGVPANLLGRAYAETALELLVNDPGMGQQITKKLYPSIAKQYDTTPSRVKRAIRHAIEVSWGAGRSRYAVGAFWKHRKADDHSH